MEFLVDESDVGRLIMSYLKERGAYETLCAFQLESGLCEGRLGPELLFIQKLVLQGRWDEVNEFLQTSKARHNLSAMIDYIILKQKFLESLSYQGGGGQRIAFPPWKPMSSNDTSADRDLVEKEVIFAQLIALQTLCSTEEFNSLCLCLTLEKLEDHPHYHNWTVSKGRVDTFQALRNILVGIMPGVNDPDHSVDNQADPAGATSTGLLRTIALSLAFQCRQEAPSNKTYYHQGLGQIVPASFNQHSHISTPSAVLASQLRYLKRFDMVLEKPSLSVGGAVSSTSRPGTAGVPLTAPVAAVAPKPTKTFITEPPLQINTTNNVFNFSGGVTTKWPTSTTPVEGASRRYADGGGGAADDVNYPPSSSASAKAPSVFWLAGDKEPPPLPSDSSRYSNNGNGFGEITPTNGGLSTKSAGVMLIAEETPASKPMPAALRKKMAAMENNKSASTDAAEGEGDVRHSLHLQPLHQLHPGQHQQPAAALPQLPVTRPVSRGRNSTGSSSAVPAAAVAEDPHQAHSAKYGYQQPPVAQQQQHLHQEAVKARPKSLPSSGSSVHSGSTASKGTAASAATAPKPPPRRADHEPTTSGAAAAAGFPSIKENVQGGNAGPSAAAAAGAKSGIPKPVSDSGSVASNRTNQSSTGPSPRPTPGSNTPTTPAAPPSSGGALQPAKYLVFQTEAESPVRCVNILEPAVATGDGAASVHVHLAIGTNDKHVHLLKYSKQDIAHEFQGVPPSTLCDARAFLSSTGTLPQIHNGSVYALDVHKEYRLMATGSNDKIVKISSIDRCEILKVLKGHNGTIRVVRFQPIYNPKAPTALVASAGGGDNCPRLWDLNKGICIQVCTAHPAAVHGLAWISLTSFITGCEGGLVVHHDITSPDMRLAFNLNSKVRQREVDLGLPNTVDGVKRGICCLALLNSECTQRPTDTSAATPVIAGCESGYLTIFDAFSGRILCNSKIHNDDIRSVSVRFQTMTLLTSSYDGTSAVWTVQYNPRECVFELIPVARLTGGHGSTSKDTKVLSAALVPHSRDVISTASDGSVMLWSL